MKEIKPFTVRQISQIDFTAANSECEHCNGGGLNGTRKIENINGDGTITEVDIVCKCVIENGGVKKESHRMFLQHNETNETRAACLVAGVVSVGKDEIQRVLGNLIKKNKKQKTELSALVEDLLRKELSKWQEQNSLQMN